MQGRSPTQSLAVLPRPESFLLANDSTLGLVIESQNVRWPLVATEDPIWGLLRIVMAQQVSTHVACRMADRAKPILEEFRTLPDPEKFRSIGLSQRRADCCVEVIRRSDEILQKVAEGHAWEQALGGIKGIGPWTISVFRIMVIRDPDVLPLGDVGLERAIANVYGRHRDVERLGETWRPFRSVACWYLWRTLGNEQLG
jgi:DNA-3-methyladenine glycosylase II